MPEREESAISVQTFEDIGALRRMYAKVAESDIGSEARECLLKADADLPQGSVEADCVADEGVGYINLPSEANGARGAYRVENYISNAFSNDDRIKIWFAVNDMVQALADGQFTLMWSRCQGKELTYARERSMPFPHALSYFRDPPSNVLSKNLEAILVLESAIDAVFNKARTRGETRLYIEKDCVHFEPPRHAHAYRNHYNDHRVLKIMLDSENWKRAPSLPGTLAHETFHNLGWWHVSESSERNSTEVMIMYQFCIVDYLRARS